MFLLYTIKLAFKNKTKEADTAPYDQDVNKLLITRQVDTAPYDKDVNKVLINEPN